MQVWTKTFHVQQKCLLSTGMSICRRDHASVACSKRSHSTHPSFCRSPNLPMYQRVCRDSQGTEHHNCIQTWHGEDNDNPILLQVHPFQNVLQLEQYLHETWCTRNVVDVLKGTKVARWHKNSTRNAPQDACLVHSTALGCKIYDARNAHGDTEMHPHHR